MLKTGQHVGPFLIEKELGSGAMGVVYRGVYEKTGQRVAVKIMLPGVADNKQSAERFQREVAILKQLNHPNIVRLLGDGNHEGRRYYAMEYIRGESLDRILARRGRLSWEEVVTLGQQLCDALQHAHDKGVIHRDLKPSNLMLLEDGTLKLTDFGIAKDLDVTQLTEANCTVGTASYMSPEQCKGERDLTHKSDLYSLGIVFYELLTGKKPFNASNVMDMFMLHTKGTAERPSRLVDIPRWLDVLVCQMLEKKPEQRPRDAKTAGAALAEVVEKVEARQSAGLETAKSGRRGIKDETDRAAAETLLSGKKKKKKKIAEKVPWHQQAWPKALGLIAAIAGIVFFLITVFKPGPKKTRRVDVEAEVVKAEEALRDTIEKLKTIRRDAMDGLSALDNRALDAGLAEEKGDLAEAKKLWLEMVDERQTSAAEWHLLAKRRLEQFQAGETAIKGFEKYIEEIDRDKKEIEIADALEKAAFVAYRFEYVQDFIEAKKRWDKLRDETRGDFQQRAWYFLAIDRAEKVKERLPEGDDKLELRRKAFRRNMDKVQHLAEKESQLRKAYALSQHLVALYGNDKDFEEQVKEIRAMQERIQKGWN